MLKKMICITCTFIQCRAFREVNRVVRVNHVNRTSSSHYQKLNSKGVHFQHRMMRIASHFTMPDCFQCMKV